MAGHEKTRRLVHVGMFYQDTRDLLDTSQRFIHEGLEAEEPVVVAQPPRQLRRLREALPSSREITYVDMTVAGRNPGRIMPWVLHDFVLRNPGRRVRVISEQVWPSRSAQVYPACVQHEALINVAMQGLEMTLLCPYDVAHLAPPAIDDAHFTHPFTQYSSGPVLANPEYTLHGLTKLIDQPLDPPPATATHTIFGPHDLYKLRELVAFAGASAGFGPHQIAACKLVVNEAVTNAVRHGGSHGTLRTWREGDFLVFDVHSPGAMPDPTAGRLQPRLDSMSGRGLVLIHHLCDLVRLASTEKSGTHVRMWMRRGA